jgi:predicted nucleic acid-binding protein
MKSLLDTSAYSAFMRGRAEINAALQEAKAIYLNTVVLGELKAVTVKKLGPVHSRIEGLALEHAA